jgi:HD-GYP domain-containing protein (c-di-GMP phosphodiesterase class II)
MTESETVENILKAIQQGVSSRQLYPPEHPRIREGIERVRALVQEATARSSAVSVFVVEDKAVFEGAPLPGVEVAIRGFMQMLRAAGYDRLTLRRGATDEEIEVFIQALADCSRHIEIAPERLKPSRHIRLSSWVGTESAAIERGFLAEEVDTLREVWTDIVEARDLDLDAVEGIVFALAKTVDENLGAMIPMAALKNHDLYTATHITNVALLAMALAEAIELPPMLVHDVGIAALLHDVGKLWVPSGILKKPDRLSDEQLAIVKRHPEDGARILLATPGVPELAVIVAYEHHIRFDMGGYPLVPRTWKQNLGSAIVQVADIYDALRSDRPYRTGLDRDTIMAMMTADAGTGFEPTLLALFFEHVVPRAAAE